MMNKIILEYLRANKDKYRLEDLKNKILSSGYSQEDFNEAIFQLNKENQEKISSVPSAISSTDKTNIDEQKPKKSMKWLWIILGNLILLIIAVGIAVWIFFDEIKSLLA